MDIASLENGLMYLGQLNTEVQTHFVFDCKESYFIFSCLRSDREANDGSFRRVEKKAVRYVRTRLAGQKSITVMDVLVRASRTEHVPSSLEALSILFILVVLGEAVIEREGTHHEFCFTMTDGVP
jgi:hypothetical protein